MVIPENLMYTPEHQWLLRAPDSEWVMLGVTDFFQMRMEEIIYVERPPEGESVVDGEPIFLIESGKTVYEFTSPLSGVLSEINELVIENPGLINTDPYGDGWLIKVTVRGNPWDSFFTPARYADYVQNYSYPLPPAT